MSWENPLPCVSLRYTYHCISIRSTKFTSNIDQRLVPPCVWYACVCLHGRRAEFARVLISAIQYSMYIVCIRRRRRRRRVLTHSTRYICDWAQIHCTHTHSSIAQVIYSTHTRRAQTFNLYKSIAPFCPETIMRIYVYMFMSVYTLSTTYIRVTVQC